MSQPTVKMKMGNDPFKNVPIMKRLSKILVILVMIITVHSIFQNGAVAPLMQDENFEDFIVSDTSTPSSWTRTVTVQAIADPVDAYGASWDGFHMAGAVLSLFATLSLTSPVDMAACVLAPSSDKAVCSLREKNGEWASICANSNDCDWTINVPRAGPYSVIIFDIDTGWSEGIYELVDVIMVSDQSSHTALPKLEELTRALIEMVSPVTVDYPMWWTGGKPAVYNKREDDRRDRGIAVVSHATAAQGTRLSQSQIYLFSH